MNKQKRTEENQSKHNNNLGVKSKFLTGKGRKEDVRGDENVPYLTGMWFCGYTYIKSIKL